MNRIWETPYDTAGVAEAVLAVLRAERDALFAVVDLHNNTGRNPHYGCIGRLDDAHLQLASLFHRIAVFVEQPSSTLANQASNFCPAIALECGRPGDPEGIEHAERFLEACLRLNALPSRPPAPEDLTLYETVARLKLSSQVTVGIDGSECHFVPSLLLRSDLDLLNFVVQPAGTPLGRVEAPPSAELVHAELKPGYAPAQPVLQIADGHLVFGDSLTPAMLTRDLRVMREDCLGYVIRPIDWARTRAAAR